MNEALELMRIVESRGGRFILEGAQVFIEPEEAALPIVESLRAHKMEIRSLLQSRTEQRAFPEATSDSLLSAWMLDRCVFRNRCSGGVGALHLDLARWCADHERPAPASRRSFERALQEEGFSVNDGFVQGLVLQEDEPRERLQRPQAINNQMRKFRFEKVR